MEFNTKLLWSIIIICFLPYPTLAGVFHSDLFQFRHEIIPNSTPLDQISTTTVALVHVSHDIASHAYGDDIRIVDDSGIIAPYKISEYQNTHEWQSIPIIDRYISDDKDIVVVDMGEYSSHATLNFDFNEASGEGNVSVFSSPVYYGIEITPWDVLIRNSAVYKNASTKQGIFTNSIVEYPQSNKEYIMLVLKHDKEKSFTFARVYKKNKNFLDSREAFYTEGESKEKDSKTYITIDTKNSIISHNRIDLTLYTATIMTNATIETSRDNNQWIYRGTDSLYHFTDNNKEIRKMFVTYEKTNDRFIKITIPQENILVHRLVQVSGPAQYLEFEYDSTKHYVLFYGNKSAHPFTMTASGISEKSFENSKEFKIGVREDNPKFIESSKPSAGSDSSFLYYAEPTIIFLISLSVLAGVFKIIKL